MGVAFCLTMSLLRTASQLGKTGARALVPGLRTTTAFSTRLQARTFVQRSLPRLGHNLEDHFDFAEFVCKMHNPLGEYIIWFAISLMFVVAFGPLMHSNYYFTGRFVPKDQGNTQLCDDSW